MGEAGGGVYAGADDGAELNDGLALRAAAARGSTPFALARAASMRAMWPGTLPPGLEDA